MFLFSPVFAMDDTDDEFHFDDYDSDNSISSDDSYDTTDSFRLKYERARSTLTIPTKVPPLKEISTVAVSIALWNHSNIVETIPAKPSTTKNTKEWQSIRSQVRQGVKTLPVPNSIATQIGKYVCKMEDEILDWISYHLRAVYFQEHYDYSLYYHIRYLVWHPNGAINRRETARNLLSSDRLSNIVKYRFLCTYCLKDEMEKLPPSVFSNYNKDYVPSHEFPLISYWNRYFRNKLNPTAAPQTLPANLDMALNQKLDNWQSKEYFFDRLCPDDQVIYAKVMIHEHKLKFQELVLRKLNETQRVQVYLDCAADIMNNCVGEGYSSDDIYPTWLEIRDLITEGQFFSIFMNLSSIRRDQTLKDIWTDAPDDLKRHALTYNDRLVIKHTFNFARYEEGYFKLELLFAMLSDTDAALKKEIIAEKCFHDLCEDFLEMGKYEFLDQLLRLCSSSDEEFANLKINLVSNSESVRGSCMMYYRNGEVNNINSFLGSLMPSESKKVISEYKRNLLMADDGIEACAHLVFPVKKNNRLRKIISDSFPTKHLATEFKKKVVSSKKNILELQKSIKKEGTALVQECIDYYLESDEDKKTLKKQIINDETFLSELLAQYDQSQWDNFIRWALEDDQAIEDFKMELNLDSVFDRVLKSCIFKKYDRERLVKCTFKKDITFDALDLFLKWYFVSAVRINTYKRRRIDSWRDIDSINTIRTFTLKRNKNEYIDALMKWFFGNNAKQIANFKKKNLNI